MNRRRNAGVGLIRNLNRAAVLALIGRRGPIARAEIARELAVSPATVTAVTRELVARGIVRVVDQVPSDGGRPALRLALVPDAGHVLGVKIAPDHLAGVIVDLEGEIVDSFAEPFDAAGPRIVDRIEAALRPVVEGRPATSPPLLGIGLGVPGLVRPDGGGTIEAPSLGWGQLPLGSILRTRLGLPVLIENDVNTLAIAERLYGRGRDVDDFITVTIGAGVGLGITARGELHRGAQGGAGELGHVTVNPDGPACYCGKRGCLETVVADPALVRDAVAEGILQADGTVADLLALADAGDYRAQGIYAAAGQVLGRAVAMVVNLLDPRLVLLSGEGIRAWPHLANAFDTTLRGDLFAPVASVEVEVDPWDEGRWALGAAALVFRSTFTASLDEPGIDDDVRGRLGLRERGNGHPPVVARDRPMAPGGAA